MLDKDLINEELELWSDLKWSKPENALNSLCLLLSNYGIEMPDVTMEGHDELLYKIEGNLKESLYLYVIVELNEEGEYEYWANVLDSNELDLVQEFIG